jgi:predicted component of type VI protein secretion system
MSKSTVLSEMRKELKELLSQCNEKEDNMFKRIYGHNHQEMSIDDIVDVMDIDAIDIAITQVKNTVNKNKKHGR